MKRHKEHRNMKASEIECVGSVLYIYGRGYIKYLFSCLLFSSRTSQTYIKNSSMFIYTIWIILSETLKLQYFISNYVIVCTCDA